MAGCSQKARISWEPIRGVRQSADSLLPDGQRAIACVEELIQQDRSRCLCAGKTPSPDSSPIAMHRAASPCEPLGKLPPRTCAPALRWRAASGQVCTAHRPGAVPVFHRDALAGGRLPERASRGLAEHRPSSWRSRLRGGGEVRGCLQLPSAPRRGSRVFYPRPRRTRHRLPKAFRVTRHLWVTRRVVSEGAGSQVTRANAQIFSYGH